LRITSKGQITIPKQWREKLGFLPGIEVEFIPEEDCLKIVKKRTGVNGEDLIRHMRGRGTVNLSTDEIMALTRGDD
jgi:AbrB family looped-hinge helix DNA binding protein